MIWALMLSALVIMGLVLYCLDIRKDFNERLSTASTLIMQQREDLIRLSWKPSRESTAAAITRNIAGLELSKDEHREIPSFSPMWGAVEIRGNSTPEILYRVFDEPSMEFVTVRAYPSLSGRVVFTCRIAPDNDHPERTQEIASQAQFEAPFWILAERLYSYFPFLPTKKEVRIVC